MTTKETTDAWPSEEAKFYHHEWGIGRLLEARSGCLFTDGGEGWRYSHSHADAKGGYDVLYRPTRPLPTISPPPPTV
jgi:hypothetical protein